MSASAPSVSPLARRLAQAGRAGEGGFLLGATAPAHAAKLWVLGLHALMFPRPAGGGAGIPQGGRA